jgi:hypothetical protein
MATLLRKLLARRPPRIALALVLTPDMVRMLARLLVRLRAAIAAAVGHVAGREQRETGDLRGRESRLVTELRELRSDYEAVRRRGVRS